MNKFSFCIGLYRQVVDPIARGAETAAAATEMAGMQVAAVAAAEVIIQMTLRYR